MTLRFPAAAAVLTVLGLAAENTAVAQPIAPPRRPTYSSYGSLFGPGLGGYYGYGYGGGGYGFGYGYGGPGFGGFGPGFGFGGPGFGFGNGLGFANRFGGMQQNMMMMQQMNVMNQNLANLQTFLATGVNPNFPITGRGAVFNNLGHWYPSAMNGGGMMGGGMMGMSGGRTAGSGIPLGGGVGGSSGGAPARTAGSGIGIPPGK